MLSWPNDGVTAEWDNQEDGNLESIRRTGHTQAARLRAHDLHVRVCVGMAALSTPVSLGHLIYNVGGRGKDGPSCH